MATENELLMALYGGGGAPQAQSGISSLFGNPLFSLGLGLMGSAGNIGQPGYQGNPLASAFQMAMQSAQFGQDEKRSQLQEKRYQSQIEQEKSAYELQKQALGMRNEELKFRQNSRMEQQAIEQENAARKAQGIAKLQEMIQVGASPQDMISLMAGIPGLEGAAMKALGQQIAPQRSGVTVNVGGSGPAPLRQALTPQELQAAGWGDLANTEGMQWGVDKAGNPKPFGSRITDTEETKRTMSDVGLEKLDQLLPRIADYQYSMKLGTPGQLTGRARWEIEKQIPDTEASYIEDLRLGVADSINKIVTGDAQPELEFRRRLKAYIPDGGTKPEEIKIKSKNIVQWLGRYERGEKAQDILKEIDGAKSQSGASGGWEEVTSPSGLKLRKKIKQ